MKTRTRRYILAIAVTIAAVAGLAASRSHSGAKTTLAALSQETHFHGIAVDATDPSRIYLATHHGLYAIAPDGTANRLSPAQDFMGFTLHPTDPSILYASGHPAGGGNLGFIVSTDGGESWEQLSEGVGGPVDFHQMDVSSADPDTIYGAYAGSLQMSEDGGQSWRVAAPVPEGLIALAASAKDVDTLYAATQAGLLVSKDGGRSWRNAYLLKRPATMAHVTPDGGLYAFVVGTGLIHTTEPNLEWQTIGNSFGDEYVLHLAVDPTDVNRLYAVTLHPQSHAQTVLASRDGGKTWQPLGQSAG